MTIWDFARHDNVVLSLILATPLSGAGDLMGQSGGPTPVTPTPTVSPRAAIVQVPANETFTSAEFRATLSAVTFATSGGAFTARSGMIDVLLLPSRGSILVADVNAATLGLVSTAMAAMAWALYRRSLSSNLRKPL